MNPVVALMFGFALLLSLASIGCSTDPHAPAWSPAFFGVAAASLLSAALVMVGTS